MKNATGSFTTDGVGPGVMTDILIRSDIAQPFDSVIAAVRSEAGADIFASWQINSSGELWVSLLNDSEHDTGELTIDYLILAESTLKGT